MCSQCRLKYFGKDGGGDGDDSEEYDSDTGPRDTGIPRSVVPIRGHGNGSPPALPKKPTASVAAPAPKPLLVEEDAEYDVEIPKHFLCPITCGSEKKHCLVAHLFCFRCGK